MTPQGAFRWHPRARVFDGAGRAVPPGAAFQPVIPDHPAGLALASALAGQGRAFRIGPGPAPDDAAEPGFETLTGGSSGTPRRIRRSQASWIASFQVNAGQFAIGPGTGIAVLGRLVHSLALYAALEALHLGADLHLLERLRPDRQRAALAVRGIRLLYATPAQLRLLVDAPGPELPLDTLIVGGSKLDPALRAALHALAPALRIHEFYGAAETSFISLAGPDAPQASVGRPYPGVDLRIRAADGTDLPSGAPGEIWVRSPYVFSDYVGDAGAARRADGWLSVGEHGRMQDGFLYLSGRAGRMVKIADQSVYPEEIELFLLSQPGVASAAVLPRPDARRGQILVAFVQGSAPDVRLLTALRHAFGPLVAPRAILRVETWPVLPSGKTDLAALERLA